MRRPTFAAAAALCSLALVFAGCGDDGGDEDTDATTTTVAGGEASSSTEAGETGDVDCDAYLDLTRLFGEADQIATGSNDGQVAADEALADAVEALRPAAEGDDELTGALDTLAEVSFQVTDSAEEGPTAQEVDAALTAVDDAWSSSCAIEDAPAPEGGDTTVPGEDTGGSGGTVPECPDPAVLEAEGFSCDSEGNLIPLDEETTTECPAPETLEAEGFTCDSEGNLTPIPGGPADGGAAGEGEADGGTQVEECPAPETLEAEGLQCDSEGNLTPVE